MKKLVCFLCLWVLGFPLSIAADDAAQLISLEKRVNHLEAEIHGAEAIRSIKRLQYAYGHYAEFGLWNDMTDLFAENGVGHYPSGTLGKEGIRKLFLQDIGKGKLGLPDGQFYPHLMLEPVVTLAPDAKTAKGRWRVLAMLGSYGGVALWAGGIYENEYILENGVWKIKDLHYYSRYTGRYEQPGWTVDKGEIPIHYDPASLGMPIPKDLPITSRKERSQTFADLGMRVADLKRRAQNLNDEQELQNLQRIYGYYVDRKMWDQVADLFTEDSTMEIGMQGLYAGKPSIRRALNQFGPAGLQEGEVNDHLQIQTIVSVAPDGRTAKARSTELIMSGVNGSGGEWGEGTFENEFVKQNGVWKFKSLHFYPRLRTDYDKGWAKDARPAAGPSKEFPPDRPPTSVYPLFPALYIPPFHFFNPVTGLPAQYPKEMGPSGKQKGPERVSNAARRPRTGGALASGIAETERLLEQAVAYDTAENLASAYGYYLDDFMWDETADLFTSDAKRDLSSIGIDVGRERIRESLKRRYPGKKSYEYLIAHQLIQPVIHVAQDGQSAKMRVRLFQLAGPSGGNGSWIAGIYECTTAMENGVWKFSAMGLDYVWAAEYKGGWAHVAPNAKGIVSTPFPKILEVPFHYANPVTGRK